MSNSNVRLYRIFKQDEPNIRMEIKGLAVKEDEIVISNVDRTEEWIASLEALAETDARNKENFAPSQEITEGDILSHFEDVLDTLNIYDAVKGTYLNEVA